MSTHDTAAVPGHDFPLCAGCRHLREMGAQDGLGWTCDAFPEEVPVAIVEGIDDHREEYPGDNGIRFEPAEEAD